MLLDSSNLHQGVDFPTSILHDQLKFCLDLVITRLPQVVVSLFSPPGLSNHNVVIGTLAQQHKVRKDQRLREASCWSKADLHGLRKTIEQADWSNIPDCDDAGRNWNTWRSQFLSLTQ